MEATGNFEQNKLSLNAARLNVQANTQPQITEGEGVGFEENRRQLNEIRALQRENEFDPSYQEFETQLLINQLEAEIKKIRDKIKDVKKKIALFGGSELGTATSMAGNILPIMLAITGDLLDASFVLGILIKVCLLFIIWKKGTLGSRIIGRIILLFDCVPIIGLLPLSTVSTAFVTWDNNRMLKSHQRNLKRLRNRLKKVMQSHDSLSQMSYSKKNQQQKK